MSSATENRFVLSDSDKKTAPDSGVLYEDEFSFVLNDGGVYLKKTEQSDERKIATIDTENLEEELRPLHQAYRTLQEKVEGLINLWETGDPESAGFWDDAVTGRDKILEEIRNAEALGDLDLLQKSVVDAFGRLTELREQSGEPVSLPAEESESASTEEPASLPAEEFESASTEEPAEGEPAEEVPVVEEPVVEEPVVEEPAVEDSENSVEEPHSGEPPASAGEPEQEEVIRYYSGLAEKAAQLLEFSDWAYVDLEFSNIEIRWSEGPDPGETSLKEFRERIDRARNEFESKKEAHFEEQKRLKEENLRKKQALLEELAAIVEAKEWTATREVGRIRSQWDPIKPVPSSAEELEVRFKKLVDEFEAHKVDRLVRQKQKEEENLVGKLLILDKMDLLLKELTASETSDWKSAAAGLEDLNRQWRKIGRVPSEKNHETWQRYHSVQDRFHELRMAGDENYRQEMEKNLSRKRQLIREAEALVDQKDLATAARQVNKLHRRWKKTGNLPQKDENELWEEFKGAIDRFNQIKTENLDQLREQESRNLEIKKELILKAVELKDSEEWEETHRRFQELMEKWKETGPVPKRQSGKIWKKFKEAMDQFYDRRRAHFREVKEGRKENLEEKQVILDKLKALLEHDNPLQAVEEAKPLQEEFKKAGHVPLKHKNRMWKEYREVCDAIYERFRAARSAAEIVGRENVGDFSGEDLTEIRNKQQESERLRREINRLEKEILQMKESLSYFKPSGKGSSLLDEVHGRIAGLEEEAAKKSEELERMEREIDQLKKA